MSIYDPITPTLANLRAALLEGMPPKGEELIFDLWEDEEFDYPEETIRRTADCRTASWSPRKAASVCSRVSSTTCRTQRRFRSCSRNRLRKSRVPPPRLWGSPIV